MLPAVMLAALCSSCCSDRTAEPIRIKVAVVYENPVVPGTDGKRVHEHFRTPGYSFSWNNPAEQLPKYMAAISEASHGVVEYEVVEEIYADSLFTYRVSDPEYKHISMDEFFGMLALPKWGVEVERDVRYDYAGMISYYGFDKKCDAGEIDEVWVYSTPLSGMYESHMMGEGAFWINSPGEPEAPCKELLSVMFFNYERDIACALESFSHRFESTMMKVYGWWDYDNRPTKEDLTTWDKYTGYAKIYSRYDGNACHIGNVHFPPNGTHDYDFVNEDYVMSYADEWLDYPDVPEKNARLINRSEWGNHEGYMKWWLGHMPHFKGMNPADGKLNNWWHYVVDYKAAVELENKLNK